ncbi:evasin-3-like [Rhipicephalus microplus]|uniref:evasin-3-like n=1 Tax=Rhipicephalus microplus TaxID=6941 RepID=UPI003F6CF148
MIRSSVENRRCHWPAESRGEVGVNAAFITDGTHNEYPRARPNALVLSVEAMTYEDDKYNINVVPCNKTCTSDGDDCPPSCFCGLLGYNTTGWCYMITGNFPEYEP